jgi:hypothetical protein
MSNLISHFNGVQLLSPMEILFHERLHGLPLVPGDAFQLLHTPKQCYLQKTL